VFVISGHRTRTQPHAALTTRPRGVVTQTLSLPTPAAIRVVVRAVRGDSAPAIPSSVTEPTGEGQILV